MNNIDERIIDAVLAREAWPTFTNHPDDDGGPTKGGITLRTLEAHRGRPSSVDDLRALTEREARLIYRGRYIEAPRFDRITDTPLRELVVDCGVLFGPERAARWLQAALNEERTWLGLTGRLPPFEPLLIDGRLGPLSLAAIPLCDARHLAIRVSALRFRKVGRRIHDDHKNVIWAAGWANRAADLLLTAALPVMPDPR